MDEVPFIISVILLVVSVGGFRYKVANSGSARVLAGLLILILSRL